MTLNVAGNMNYSSFSAARAHPVSGHVPPQQIAQRKKFFNVLLALAFVLMMIVVLLSYIVEPHIVGMVKSVSPDADAKTATSPISSMPHPTSNPTAVVTFARGPLGDLPDAYTTPVATPAPTPTPKPPAPTPTSVPPTSNQLAVNQPTTNQPAANQPTANQPTANPPAPKPPAPTPTPVPPAAKPKTSTGPVATPTPSINAAALTPAQLYNAVTSRPLSYSSALSGPDNAQWDQFAYSGGGSCGFANGTYQAWMPQLSHLAACLEHGIYVTNFGFQVQMTIRSGAGEDGGGIVFRGTNADAIYRLRIGLDGSYDLTGTNARGTSPAIIQGINNTNLVTVIAQGNLIFIYVNGQCIIQTSATFSNQGDVGFMAVGWSQPTTVTFTNAQLWQF
jgi:outer membrane biosynthesis protein TonB